MDEKLIAARAMPAPDLAPRAWTPCWENLNKLEWINGFTFISHGVTLSVRVNDASLLEILFRRLPKGARLSSAKTVQRYFSVILGGRKDGSRIRTFNMLYVNHEMVARSHHLDEVLDGFDTWVRLTVAQYAPRRVFLHAGAVGWRGRAIILPGKTNTGKSTLVLELVKAGANYYSDELAPLDKNGRVHPFHRPISMRDPTTHRQSGVSVENIGGELGNEPLPVGLVVLSQYEDAATWRPEKLSPGRALLEMLANTVGARDAAERTLTTLQRVAHSSLVVKSRRGDAAATAALILDCMN